MMSYKTIGVSFGAVVASLVFVASASAATLTLSPSTKTVNVGDTFSVDVLLDTQNQPIDGVDIHALNYNPYNLQLQGTQIQAGTLMPNTVANSADTVNGRILFSQITNGGSTFTGSGKLATLTFKALVAGTAKVTLDATPGVTTDSNVASNGSDILTSVVNGIFTINNSSAGSSGTGTTGTGTTGTGTTTPPPPTGSNASLLALLVQLQAELKALVIQAIAKGINLPAGLAQSLGIGTSGGSTSSGAFTRNLSLGMSGEDVRALQVFLNSHGFVITTYGPGSPGNEVIVFGLKTQAALIGFQRANGLPATGFFGALTRAKVEAIQ